MNLIGPALLVFLLIMSPCQTLLAHRAFPANQEVPAASPVTYGDIMGEFDHYIAALSHIEWQESYLLAQQRLMGDPGYASNRLDALYREREFLLQRLTHMQQALDSSYVDIATGLMGSQTGYDSQGNALPRQTNLPAGEKKAHRKPSDDDDGDDISNPYGDIFFTPLYSGGAGNRHSSRQLKTTKALLNNNESLTLEQVRMVSGLGSVGSRWWQKRQRPGFRGNSSPQIPLPRVHGHH